MNYTLPDVYLFLLSVQYISRILLFVSYEAAEIHEKMLTVKVIFEDHHLKEINI